jgi:two-component system sensor histidine kinase PilS (NtrC family)
MTGCNSTSRMVAQGTLLRLVKGLLVGRLIVVTALWGTLISVELAWDIPAAHGTLMGLVILTYGLTIVYGLSLGRRLPLERWYHLQVSLDLLLVSALVHSTGGLDSGVAWLYLLTILAAGLALPRAAVFVLAAGASGLYGLLAYLEVTGLLPPVPFPFALPRETPVSGLVAAYAVVLMAAACALIAWLSSTLAASLRQMEQALAMHIRQWRSLTSGLLLTDRTGRVRAANDAASRLFGLTPDALQARSAQDLFPFLDTEALLQHAETPDPRRQRTEGLYEHPDGRKLTLGVSWAPVSDDCGALDGLVWLFQDITMIRVLEGETRRTEQRAAVRQASAAMAHEIRNPLASISSALQYLREELPLDASQQRLLDTIVGEIHRLSTALTESLTTTPQAFVAVDVHQLLEETLALLRLGLPAGSTVVIQTQLAAEVPPLLADPQGLREVIWNLGLNAIQAMPDQGTLTVRMRIHTEPPPAADASIDPPPAASELIIDVTDTGPGIPLDVQDKMLDPFYSTKRGGTGLGLTIVHSILANHGGWLEVDSAPGHGTTMRIHLPLQLAPTASISRFAWDDCTRLRHLPEGIDQDSSPPIADHSDRLRPADRTDAVVASPPLS